MMGQVIDAPVSPDPMAQALRTEFTDVETATRIQASNQEVLMRFVQRKIYEPLGVRVDSTFLQVFNYEFVHGDPNTAMTQNNAIVLSESVAQKLFGTKNPMGEIVNLNDQMDCIVTGVVKTPAIKGHFEFNLFMAYNDVQNIWISNNYHTYFKLKEGVDISTFKEKMVENFMAKMTPNVEQFLKITVEEFFEQGNTFEYQIQKLEDIHLHSHKEWEIRQNGNIIYVYVFIGIALLVIIIAGINFMNLSTARSAKRAKEVGVRKVTGASRKMLIVQFLTESVIQSVLALFLAYILVELFLPRFNNILESNLVLINDHLGQTIVFSLAVTVFYGLFAGSYPAFFLSGFQPVSVLKGDFSKGKGGALFRKILVITQFTASTILIIGMIIVFQQIKFLHNKDLGFQGDQVIVVPLKTRVMADNFNNYKDIFLKNSKVLNVSRASYFPGDNPNQNMYVLEGREEQLPLWNLEIDYDFFETLDIKLVAGRFFEKEKQSDSLPYFILNETAVKNLNIENPFGKRIGYYTSQQGDLAYGPVIGVVKDFHVEGFNQEIRPMLMSINDYMRFAAFKIATTDMPATIDYIEQEWNKLEPAHTFRYTFLNEKFGALLRQQENFGRMFLYLTILAIIISAMGLYGLASFTAEQRTKEIGVRKVLGASVPQLMKMLTSDFIKLVLLANIFAWPLTYILAKDWLANFSYQINMPILPYLFATILALIIALITVSAQAYQAANADPVDALKYE
jgi:putative ABC transport system permease protein